MSPSIYAYVRQNSMQNNKKPYSCRLIAEYSASLYFVDSSNQTVLLKTDDEGVTVSTVTTRTLKIQAMWIDRANDKLWCVDCENTGDTFTVWYVDLTDDSITEIASLIGATAGTVTAYDIFIIGSNTYVLCRANLGAGLIYYVYDVDANPFVQSSSIVLATTFLFYSGLVTGNIYYWFWTAPLPTLYCMSFDASGPSISQNDVIDLYDRPSDNRLWNMSYDNIDLLYLIATTGGKNYLMTYSITDDEIVDTGLEYNVSLMLDRQTDSSNVPECFALEKAFAISLTTNYKALIYQISRIRGALNFLGQISLSSGDVINSITDYFLIIDRTGSGGDVEVWQYQDIMSTQIAKCEIHAKKRIWYTIELQWLDLGAGYQDPPVRDQFIQIFGTYTSYTLGGTYTETNHIIAEGLVRTHDLKLTRNVTVVSLAKEELQNISPNISDYTNYTGKTSGQIIDQLIDDYCKTIQVGTISNGSTTWTCPDDWKAQGDKSLEQIFNELADTEEFQWYLRPDNSLDFNDGTVDSQQTFATTDSCWNFEAQQLSQNINQIELMGGFVDGTQIGPATANDLAHQQLYGNIVKWSKTYASVLDATILQTIADAKLNLQGAAPLVYWAERDVSSDWGFIQVGELITMEAVRVDPDSDQTLPTGDYILDENTFDAKNQTSDLKLTDGLLFQEDASMNLAEQNSQLIQQTASTVREIARPNTTSLSPDHTAEGCIVILTAGENLVFGEVCYFKSDGKCWKADSSATTTMPVSFMALASITADNTGLFLIWGTVRDDSWNWTVGGLIYISTTAGSLTQTAPAGEEIQVCGIALSADIMLFFLNFQYISDLVYDATNWNNKLQAPSMNAVRDKIQLLAFGRAPSRITYGDGFAEGTYGYYAPHADTNAFITFAWTVPETRSDWKITFYHYSDTASRDDSGKIYLGDNASGEGRDVTSIFNGENHDLTENVVANTIYVTDTSTFSATKGDVLLGYWQMDNNDGTGNLVIIDISLRY